uniref:Uncharacterized protein n=1 Tax=Physcomitrium patens TaxID=3218 RepID=A0A2K1JPQ1_PHYPA|nr:hypothetical protein PHYPA_015901 [Physcomitrium patens]
MAQCGTLTLTAKSRGHGTSPSRCSLQLGALLQKTTKFEGANAVTATLRWQITRAFQQRAATAPTQNLATKPWRNLRLHSSTL